MLIGAVAFAALAPQLVTPPAAVPGGRVVLALDQMPSVGGEPRYYGAPLVEEADAFWIAQPAPGEFVAVPARWSPTDAGPDCEVLALGLPDPSVLARAAQDVGRAEHVTRSERRLEQLLPGLDGQSLPTNRSMRSQASSMRSIDAA